MSLEPNGQLVPVGGGDNIPLIRATLTVGRRDTCDIPMRFANISGLHCELTFDDGYWYIRDLNSTNGVKVNGMRVLKKLLAPGDEVTIGKRRFTIEYELAAGKTAREELEEDIMSQSLLERAGLERSRRRDYDDDRLLTPGGDDDDRLLTPGGGHEDQPTTPDSSADSSAPSEPEA